MGNFLSNEAPTNSSGAGTDQKFQNIRMIKSRGLTRLTFDEQQKVKLTFDRLQDASLLPYWQFRMAVVGPQVPETICIRLYELFASQTVPQIVHELDDVEKPQTELQCAMNLDDLLQFHQSLKNHSDFDQITYWLIKSKVSRMNYIQVTIDQKSAQEADNPFYLYNAEMMRYLQKLGKNSQAKYEELQQRFQQVGLILNNDQPLSFKDFTDKYAKIKDLLAFQWLFQIFKGYKNHNLNWQEDKMERKTSEERRLSQANIQKTKQNLERQTKLTSEDLQLIQDFYDQEIKGRNAKYAHAVYSKMFREIPNQTLRQKYFLQNAVSKSGNISKYEWLCQLVRVVVREPEDEDLKTKFLFNILTDHSQLMQKKQLKDFCEIFKVPITDFNQQKNYNLDEFAEVVDEYEINWDEFEVCRGILISMMCLTPANELDEKQAILSAVNQNPNIESYIFDNFTSEIEQFYICEKQFWEQWQQSIGFQEEGDQLGLRVEHKSVIENRKILEKKHMFRVKDHCQYLNEYVILPKFVFQPLAKWYGVDKVIKREVITYKDNGTTAVRSKVKSLSTSLHGTGMSGKGLQRQDSLRSSYSKNFKLSGNKFYNKKQQELLDDDYVTLKDGLVFELEISPKVIYLAEVSQTGELMYTSLIDQNKVDYMHLKKILKLDKLPFEELQLSRKTTFDQLLIQASKNAKKNPKKGRLLINGQVLSQTKLMQTFEDYKLENGTLIHYEFINDQNEWPSEQKVENKKTSTPAKEQKKTSGLANLGNTCYMGSAIQLLANIPQFYEYFVELQQYRNQINPRAVMGHKGKLALAFGTLMNQMWSQNEQLKPEFFKSVLGRCSEQYSTFEQQDAQEYVSFMIDSLHEELNLRLKKPYIQNPDSKGREMLSLANENWSNTLRREWSFIFFLFYGQMRSNLLCKTCQTESTTFDIFSNIPVPLPEPNQQTISIIVHRIPNKIKDVVFNKIKKLSDDTYQLPTFEDVDMAASGRGDTGMFFGKSSNSARNTTYLRQRTGTHTTQFTESYNYLTNDQPLRIHIKIEQDTQIKDIIKKILLLRECNLDATQLKTNLIFYTLNPKTRFIRRVFSPNDKLTEVDILTAEIHCHEVITRIGRDFIRRFYQENKDFGQQFPDLRLKTLTFPSARDELDPKTYNTQDITVVCYHRRFISKQDNQISKYTPQLLATPFIIQIPAFPTGRRLYDEVWAIASNLVRHNSKLQQPRNRWWERKDWDKNIENNLLFKPFILKKTTRDGLRCATCNWIKACSGCIVQPIDYPDFIDDLGTENVTLVIEWHSETLNESYNPIIQEVVDHSSVQLELDDAAIVNYTSLDDCLIKFHKPEVLENEMRCTKCQDLTPHLKKLEIFRPPPILIITLKRFRQVGSHWRKIQANVDFPLKNLDISAFAPDLNFLKSQDIQTKYDLHGIVNHFGTLTYGHYTCYVQNHFDQQWYLYDDNRCNLVQSDQNIIRDNAYILFYIRKDIQSKKVNDIYPTIETSLFSGRPVTIKEKQNAFVTKVLNQTQFEVQFIDDQTKQPKTLSLNDIQPETDSSLIKLSDQEEKRLHTLFQANLASELEQTQSIKRKTSQENSSRCCGLFPSAQPESLTQTQVRRFTEKHENMRKLESSKTNLIKQNSELRQSTNSKNRQSVSAKPREPTHTRNNLEIDRIKSMPLRKDSDSQSVDIDRGELTDQENDMNTTVVYKSNQTPSNKQTIEIV